MGETKPGGPKWNMDQLSQDSTAAQSLKTGASVMLTAATIQAKGRIVSHAVGPVLGVTCSAHLRRAALVAMFAGDAYGTLWLPISFAGPSHECIIFAGPAPEWSNDAPE